MESSVHIWRIVGWTVVAFLSLLIPVFWIGHMTLAKSYALGYLVSLINIVSSLLSIRWAFRRSIKTFYLVVFGGMMLRFFFIAAMVYLVIAVLHWPLSGFLISFIVFYVFLQYQETRYINTELKGNKSTRYDQSNR